MKQEKDNKDLQTARNNKADEFYTMYEDIEAEMILYKDKFKDKIVYCPCDDYRVSKFWAFFRDNFNKLGLKQLIATGYLEPFGTFASFDGVSYYTKMTENETADFRSDYVKNLMRTADIIVTNPPFSLSKDFMQQLIDLNKDFIIVGNVNSITYKGIFSHFVDGTMRLGGSIHSGDRKFYIPDDYPLDGTACGVDIHGKRYIRVKGVRWFTNIADFDCPDVKHTVLSMNYSPDIHQKYDTYNAINANTMKEIPFDYYDEIGAPITVIDKMNKDGLLEFKISNDEIILFKIIGQLNGGTNKENFDFAKPIIDGKCKFKRILIKRI